MSEKDIQTTIMLALGKIRNLRVFRNHVGKGVTGRIIRGKSPGEWHVTNGRMTTFGLGPDTPDLVGWETITVTPAMVGQKIATIFFVEVKDLKGALSPGQRTFIEFARGMGCKVVVARSAEEAVAQIVTAELGL